MRLIKGFLKIAVRCVDIAVPRNTGQAVARFKCRIPDRRYSEWNLYTRQAVASRKCTLPAHNEAAKQLLR